jgi:O-antigen ligase
MDLDANTSIKAGLTANSGSGSVRLGLAIFALLACTIASISVLLNDLYFWGQSPHYINPYLFLITFLMALPRKTRGFMGCIFLLPLSAGLGSQLNAYLGSSFLVLPNAGLDLVAGFFIGSLVGSLRSLGSFFDTKGSSSCNANFIKTLAPWPVALVMAMITISTAIAISRNIFQSATQASLKGLLFNLVHFRPIDWHDDYMPISDWIAYALALAIIAVVIGYLKNHSNRNQIIFRPLIGGLVLAALMGILQATTGLGLPESLLSFRKDQLGYAVIGFQPDLHAYAGHMLLGAIGLWGYFYSGLSRYERQIIVFVIALSWIGLILSKSRALLIFATIVMFIWLIYHLWREKRHLVVPILILSLSSVGIFLALIFINSNSLAGIPVLSWLGELANQFKSRDLTSWSLLSGIFGARFEIWEGALRMWSQFPLMGVGQGDFYRLSDIASFSRSNFLILNHGENAHNYFLQTFTETGLIGASIFLLAFVVPFSILKNQRIAFPAAIALMSLLLGNIFSHSFLVRENLMLGAVLIGALYLFYEEKAVISPYRSRKTLLIGIFLSILVLIFGAWEVYGSFGKKPFERGYYCYLGKDLQTDGWSSGQFEIQVPANVNSILLQLHTERPKALKDQLGISIFALKNGVGEAVSLVEGNFLGSQDGMHELKVPEQLADQSFRLVVRSSECYTPRNLGISSDARRLGMRVGNLELNK